MQSNWPDASFRIATPLALLLFIPRPSDFVLFVLCTQQRVNAAHLNMAVALDILVRCGGLVLPAASAAVKRSDTSHCPVDLGIDHSKSKHCSQAVFQWSS